MTVNHVGHDRILSPTRWVALLVIPFLVVAFVILYVFPQETERLFAWKLQPPMTAMMLAAAYAGGIYFFTGVLVSKAWHRIKVGFLPVITFASLLGIATILHWDRFNHSHVAFYAWAGLYFTTPFVVLGAWLRNRRQDTGRAEAQDFMLAWWVRLFVGLVGVATLLISIVLFVVPETMIEVWPWTLSPLTARVMSAMFSLPGLVGIGIASDARWSSARIILQSQAFSIILILIAAARSGLDPANPTTPIFTGGLMAMLGAIVLLYLLAETRRV